MPTRRGALFILCAGLCALSARPATDAAALAFVTSIYDAYKGKDAKGPPLDNTRTVRRYFEPSLAALINHARPPPRGAASVWMLGRTMSAFG
jgi:hypothetical protein